MSLTTRIARGATAQLAAQVLRVGTKGLVMLLLTRVFLSPGEYGLLFYAISVLGMAVLLANLGLAKSGARYIAEYHETDPGQIPHILRSTLGYNVAMILVVSAGVALLHEQVAAALNSPELGPLLLLGAGYVVALSLQKATTLLFQGFNRVSYSAAVSVVGNVSTVVFIVALLSLGAGVGGALLGYALGYAVAAVAGLFVLYRWFYAEFDAAAAPEDGLPRRILEYSVPLTATRGANVLDKRVDTVLVGFFLTPVAVGFYTLGKQITDFVIAPATSLGFAVSPAYGERKANDELDHAARIYETTFEYTLALYVPAAAGLFIVAEPAIRHVFGSDYLGAVPVLQVFSLYVLLRAIDKITNDGLDYLGRARARAIVKGATSVSNFGLNLVLIPAMGVVGAAVATVMTYSAMVAVELYLVYRELAVSTARLLRAAALVGVVTVGMVAAVAPLSSYISGVATLAGVVLVGVGVWGALATTAGLVDVGQLRSAIAS
ncbi:flippase [Halostella litorea]|uniref:flippase n=1 Tax=Halostella litorea TaxID=2528831 RepID=UPI001092E486|nr:flippase [Halostella litorea]